MNCYLCKSTSFKTRKGKVRDVPDLKILECAACGLVTLSSLEHIQAGFYENSGMHGQALVPIGTWLKDTDWDDQRRFELFRVALANKKVLDFGCGAGGFLVKAQSLAAQVAGIELEQRVQTHWAGRLTIHSDIVSAGVGYELITAFHVVEHLPDPRKTLQSLAQLMARNGRMIIEVPSSQDALLTLFDCDAFQRFTYWSQHLFLFNAETLRQLATQAGLKVIAMQQYQRYPLSNHLHWLSQGNPGGHQKWSFLNSPILAEAYANTLAAIGKCDTLVAHLELEP
jgi:2-polyprenyl-3-methyl-5-hydroxy-6-metoxy-1,4-benzoquinol methylase